MTSCSSTEKFAEVFRSTSTPPVFFFNQKHPLCFFTMFFHNVFFLNHIIYIPLLSVLHVCQDFRGFVVVYFVLFNVFQVLPFLSDLLYCLCHYFSHFQFHFVKCFDFVSLFILHPVLSLFSFFSLPPCFQLFASISAPCIFLAGLYLPVAHPAIQHLL